MPAIIEEQNLDIFNMLASLIAFELEADDQRRQQARELEHAREAASRDERFIGVLGHELRTPLAAIKGLSQLLLRRSEVSEQSRTDLQRIVASADRLNRLTHDILDFTRVRLGSDLSVEPCETDLGELCRQYLDEVRMEHPDRLIRLEAAGDLRGNWDPDRLGQVITNLAGNAVNYSPELSPVAVIVRSDQAGIALEVQNDGEPIPADELAHIFDPFQQGRQTSGRSGAQGLGLGLAIVRHIVLAHGGTITVRSSAEEGTVFTVRLPRNTGAPGLTNSA